MAAGQAATQALTPAQRATFADDLLANTKVLDKRVQTLDYTVDQIGNGSKGLLDEVASGKITGEEDIWSHTDLYDFQANVDGARVGYEGLKPLLEVKDPELSKQIADARSTPCRRCSTSTSVGEDGFVFYDKVTEAAAQGALRRGQRAGRAAVQDDGSHHSVTDPTAPATTRSGALSRRRLLGAAGAGALAVGAAGVGGFAYGHEPEEPTRRASTRRRYPFQGAHQAGITTPAQDRLHFAAFDVTTDSREELVALLQGVDRGGRAQMTAGSAGRAARCPRRTTPRRPTPARPSASTPPG